jgi:hypothetical protein
MTNPTIRIHNAQTDEIIDRPMTDDELAQWETNKAEANTKVQKEIETAEAKKALLTRLGITEEEAKLLLGGN